MKNISITDSKVIIFIATYKGQLYLAEQLESIIHQTHTHWEIWVSDDGSDDNTGQILNHYQTRVGKQIFHITQGPCKGFAANFLSLVCNKNAQGDYYSYSDQDDIWHPQKLERALQMLHATRDVPALYCSRTELIDHHKNHIGFSPIFQKAPSFLNALVQNIGGGNTMVFNDDALQLLRTAGQDVDIVSHDWWTYMVITGAGGACYYDAEPSLLYRQHPANIIGANHGWKARIYRIYRLFNNHFRLWNDKNTQALIANQHLLTTHNRVVLNTFILARNSGLLRRITHMYRSGIHRQTLLGNLGLIAACVFNKI